MAYKLLCPFVSARLVSVTFSTSNKRTPFLKLNVYKFGNINVTPSCIRTLFTSPIIFKRRKGSLEAERNSLIIDKKKDGAKVIEVWKNISVNQLASAVDRPIDTVFEAMLYVPKSDVYDNPVSQIDDIQVTFGIAKKLGFKCKIVAPPVETLDETNDKGHLTEDVEPRPICEADLLPRPPVVTIMGHVDHGKTTLLDALRKSNIVSTEAGGITQHIGAFQVTIDSHKITFLDTPGHAAFSALRNRGAKVTDMVILVVAADDGVMEQTRESISMIKDANVPMIVAINKIDRGNADTERTKKMLLQEGIQLENFGGDIQAVEVSALKGTNLSVLLDAVFLQAEMMNLKSEHKGMVEGVVIESSIDHGRGKLTTALIQRGVLRKSAILVAGTAWAKVRGIFDETGDTMSLAGPSSPVEIIGWRDLPSAGDKIFEVESEKRAKEVVNYRKSLQMSEKQQQDSVVVEQKVVEHLKEYKAALAAKRKMGYRKIRRVGPRTKEIIDDGEIKLALVVKGDVDGSVEAFLDILDTYDCHDQCRLDLVHYGVGDISENDIKMAEAFSAVIYGFNVSISDNLEKECQKKKIQFRMSNIIYRLVESLKVDLMTKLPPNYEEEILGEANVLALFQVTEGKKKVSIAGSRCTKGLLRKNALFRLKRDSEILFDGKLMSMRHEKNDVESIKNGLECGLGFSDPTILPKEGDIIICYHLVEVKQKSDWDPGF